jgi:hypothetical protein
VLLSHASHWHTSVGLERLRLGIATTHTHLIGVQAMQRSGAPWYVKQSVVSSAPNVILARIMDEMFLLMTQGFVGPNGAGQREAACRKLARERSRFASLTLRLGLDVKLCRSMASGAERGVLT